MIATLLSLMLTCGDCAGDEAAHAKAGANHSEAVCEHPMNAPAAAATDASQVVTRGDKLKGLKSVELGALLAAPADHDGKEIAVEGKVRRACKAKGCWMELATSDKGPGVRVTFKDYGFFVPLDSAGRTAKVEGKVVVAGLSDEKAKHLEAEGATVPRGPDGKAREVQLIAYGVELRK